MKLTLSKIKKNGKVELLVRERSSFLTKEFLLALGIAILIHLGALTLFDIDIGNLLKQVKPLGPMFVSSDSPKMGLEISQEEEKKLVPAYLEMERPKLTALLSHFEQAEGEFSKSSPTHTIDFSGIEIEEIKGTFLSTLHFSKGMLPKKQPPPLTARKRCKGVLQFRALTNTGEIFWIDWIESTGNRNLDQEIEAFLKTVQLEATGAVFATSGTVEVEFYDPS